MASMTELDQLGAALNATLQHEASVSAHTDAAIWRLQAATIVFFMQVGFALVEAGSVRAKNTQNIMVKNVMDACFCAAAFWTFGWALGFGEGSSVIGWRNESQSIALFNEGNQVNFFFQYTFAATSVTITSGAVAERFRLKAYLLYVVVHSGFMYPMIAHFIWAGTGLMGARVRETAFLGTDGVLDNAGSLVVHVTGGVASLVAAWMVGPRIGRYDIEGRPVPFKPNSVSFVAAGTLILWAGFYGFNAGSVDLGSLDIIVWYEQLARVCSNTTLCAAFAGCTAYFMTTRRGGSPPDHLFNAVLGGCVAACATSSVTDSWAACVIGMVAGAIYLGGVRLMAFLEIDDPVHSVAVHLACGTWGGLSAGLFATADGIRSTYGIENPRDVGVFYGGSGHLLGVQILALLLVYAWVGAITLTLFGTLRYFGRLRVPRHEEEIGLDVALHGAAEPLGQSDRLKGVFVNPTPHVAPGFQFSSLKRRIASAVPTDCASLRLKAQRDRGGMWQEKLKKTSYGDFSFAMYEANYVMEDTSQVEASNSGVFMGVYDGHGGSEAATFVEATLFRNLQRAMVAGNGVSGAAILQAFEDTEEQFATLVTEEFENAPHLACVGAAAVVALVTDGALYVANCGDSRAVLGVLDDGAPVAVQLSVDHSVKAPAERAKYLTEHPGTPDLVMETPGGPRIKGKLQVTRAFGDCYMKSLAFNRNPLFPRFRVPGHYTPPLITAVPHVAIYTLRAKDKFLILASGGLWEYVTNQEAVDIVHAIPKKEIARHLVKIALERAAAKHEIPYSELVQMSPGRRREFHDDITVIVFFFAPAKTAEEPADKVSGWQTTVSVVGGEGSDLDTFRSRSISKTSFGLEGSVHGSGRLSEFSRPGSGSRPLKSPAPPESNGTH
ncbi:Protein phosphatase 2C family protein [Klebsormidium nitens]|uniref:protein-serine/threonine phosphatase n=1 Tax=Klebsormidium nitens TaxID=105231 RepID=A0A1Y1I2H8_KLENI|nr:Protein phosphatase 2C family protein [Klebsormidium nitens]|eukprot:GAQ84673.1 Protein phosphatase 2C family protein [Klebsormidium nitens]